ncbi:hypothetical protein BJ741DRAFT_609141 [Chytriomyces cf. hyalinus JEL632]|nr:hypothetical protein BJ741DRAFT_609141 [Chytriomyces cf. hyalinus JEL632]
MVASSGGFWGLLFWALCPSCNKSLKNTTTTLPATTTTSRVPFEPIPPFFAAGQMHSLTATATDTMPVLGTETGTAMATESAEFPFNTGTGTKVVKGASATTTTSPLPPDQYLLSQFAFYWNQLEPCQQYGFTNYTDAFPPKLATVSAICSMTDDDFRTIEIFGLHICESDVNATIYGLELERLTQTNTCHLFSHSSQATQTFGFETETNLATETEPATISSSSSALNLMAAAAKTTETETKTETETETETETDFFTATGTARTIKGAPTVTTSEIHFVVQLLHYWRIMDECHQSGFTNRSSIIFPPTSSRIKGFCAFSAPDFREMEDNARENCPEDGISRLAALVFVSFATSYDCHPYRTTSRAAAPVVPFGGGTETEACTTTTTTTTRKPRKTHNYRPKYAPRPDYYNGWGVRHKKQESRVKPYEWRPQIPRKEPSIKVPEFQYDPDRKMSVPRVKAKPFVYTFPTPTTTATTFTPANAIRHHKRPRPRPKHYNGHG